MIENYFRHLSLPFRWTSGIWRRVARGSSAPTAFKMWRGLMVVSSALLMMFSSPQISGAQSVSVKQGEKSQQAAGTSDLAVKKFPVGIASGVIETFDPKDGFKDNWKVTGSFGRNNEPTNIEEFNSRHSSTPIVKTSQSGAFTALTLNRTVFETGKAVSSSFIIPKDWSKISFDIMGGNDVAKTAFRLVTDADGKAVRTAAGDNSLTFTHKFWKVSDLRDQSVHLEIEDSSTGNFGFIGVGNVKGVTEAAVVNSNKIDFNNLPYQGTVQQMAEQWRSKYNLPGVWCAYIKNGQVVACVASGYKNLESKTPASVDDHLNIGSVSKVITGTMLAEFVALGVINYETTIAQVFPEIALKYSSSPVARATLRQLMTHNAGISDKMIFDTTDKKDGIAWRRTSISTAFSSSLGREPGVSYEYCNAGAVIATAMVEKRLEDNKQLASVYGASYEEWLTGQIGKVIGLTNPKMLDYSRLPTDSEIQPYLLDSEGTVRPNLNTRRDSFVYAPQGSCSLTIGDLCRFTLGTLNNSAELSKDIYLDTIQFRPEMKGDLITSASWHGNDLKFLWHNGDTGRGEYCEVWVSTNSKNAVIFYSNITRVQEIRKDLLDLVKLR